jgi:hypothetical protein
LNPVIPPAAGIGCDGALGALVDDSFALGAGFLDLAVGAVITTIL